MLTGTVSSVNFSLILCNRSQTDEALMYPVLRMVINSLPMASAAPETLYPLLPDGAGRNILTGHYKYPAKAPQTKCAAQPLCVARKIFFNVTPYCIPVYLQYPTCQIILQTASL
jgi:hypothetical protein